MGIYWLKCKKCGEHAIFTSIGNWHMIQGCKCKPEKKVKL